MGSPLIPGDWAFLGGQLVALDDTRLPADTHALNFGTAAFESFRVYASPDGPAILGLRRHLDRLRVSLHYFAADAPDDARIASALWSTIEQNAIENGYLRLLVLPSGSCARFDPAAYRWDLVVLGYHDPQTASRAPMRLAVSQVRRPPVGSTLPRAKLTGFYAADVAAHAAAHRLGFDDALVLHHDGTVCEMTGANVFMVRDGELITPLLAGTIDGVTRRLVMSLAAEMGAPVREAALPLGDFVTADEVFLTATYHEICPVSAIGDHAIRDPHGPLTRRLQERFADVVRGRDATLAPEWLTRKPRPAAARDAARRSFRIAAVTAEDVPHVVEAVRCLIEELRGGVPTTLPAGADQVCARIVDKTSPGAIFVARSLDDGSRVGVITASVQEAVHVGGPYTLIQDLWVRPDRRSDGVGAALIDAVNGYCSEQRIAAMEVCLPRYTFANLARTQRFYSSCGFVSIGPRMRRNVS